MKNLYVLLFLFISGYTVTKAQNAADYSFQATAGVQPEDISSGSTLIFANGQDDVSSSIMELPFTFKFAGINYSQFSVSTNGLVGFGSIPVTHIGVDHLLHESGSYPILAPWWEDLYTAANGSIHYKTVENAGQRKLIVEWKVRKFKASSTLLYDKTFQVWLFEGSNRIQYVYGNGVFDVFTTSSIGTASSATDYICINSANHTASSTTSSETNAWPGNGSSYIFSPVTGSVDPISIGQNGSVTNVSCHGENNGSITLGTIAGGDGNYVVSWTGANGFTATGNTVTGLSTGTYHYTVTDGLQSEPVTGDVQITEPATVTLSVTSTNISCHGANDGHITVTSNGNYTIKDAAGNDLTIYSHFAPGVYTIEASTAGGNEGDLCNATPLTVTITQPELLSAVIGNVTNVTYNGESNGSVSIIVSGGTPPYTYTLQGVSNETGVFNGLATGNYDVVVKDANQCTSTVIARIERPLELTATVSSTNGTCNGTTDGTITISDANGGSGSFEYRLNTGSWQTSGYFSALASGAYNVQMRDLVEPGNVKDLVITTITKSGAAPVVSITPSAPAFCSNLTLTANAANAINYAWSHGENTRTTNLSISNADGDYSVVVTNAIGCTSSAVYNYRKQNLLNSYTILGLKSVSLGENNIVNGAVGDTTKGETISINKNSVINGFVKASKITLSQPVNVTSGLINVNANIELPAMFNNTSIISTLTNLNLPDDYNGPAITGNFNQLTIGRRSNVTIRGNVYGKIILKEGADVVFTANDLSIAEIQTDNGKNLTNSVDYTTMTFAANTIIRIKHKIDLGERNRVYGAGSTFYLGDENTDSENITISGKNTIFNANVYLPHGRLNVKGPDANNNCTMNGMFIAEEITAEKFVNWNGNNCTAAPDADPDPVPVSFSVTDKIEAEGTGATLSGELKHKVYPNPNNGRFTLQLNHKTASNTEVIIMNQNGAQVMYKKLSKAEAGQTLQLDIHKHAAGIYIVKVIIDQDVQIMKMVVKK